MITIKDNKKYIAISITGDDYDRIRAIKQLDGKDKVPDDIYAYGLLQEYINKLYFPSPHFDDNGRLFMLEEQRKDFEKRKKKLQIEQPS